MLRITILVLLLLSLSPLVLWAQEAVPEEAPPPPPPPPVDPNQPLQVNVSVKIVEFQATKGVETGLSAYFRKRDKVDWFGVVHPARLGLLNADVTFPTTTGGGITVFLDNLRLTEGDLEMVLQALANENKASILSRPRGYARVGEPYVMSLKTITEIPYENTQVVGNTAQQTTDFRETGVTLTVTVPEIVDDDGDWFNTKDDSYIRLNIQADVKEEGQRLVVALDDSVSGGTFTVAQNQITAPELVSRSIDTNVWVRNGQVLMLGGLYRNSKNKSLRTAPWLPQAENLAVGLAERLIPGNFLGSPVTATVGNRAVEDSRRELVFFIKCETWRPAFIVDHGFEDEEETSTKRMLPTDVLTDVITGISEIPKGIAEEIVGPQGEGLGSQLGDDN